MEAEIESMNGLVDSEDALAAAGIRYLVFGKETAPTTGCVHIQGYVYFTNARSMAGVKRILSSRLHLEKSKGSPQQNREYCQKDGEWKEAGSIPQQGARTDLQAVQSLLDGGATMLDVSRAHFREFVMYRNNLEIYRRMVNSRRVSSEFSLSDFPEAWPREYNWDRSVIIWGESGIGKTEYAKALLPGALMVSHMDDLLEFDPDTHSGIIFDDMDFKHLPRTSQIHLVDVDNDRSIHCRYRTAFVPARTKKIFTTNESSGLIVELADAAVKRRIEVHHLINSF